MIQDYAAEFHNGRINWVLTRLPNLELNFAKLLYAMDCADDPLSINICTERYTDAIIAFLTNRDFNIFKDENDAQWLDDPEVKNFFIMDAMYFRTVNPAYALIIDIKVLTAGNVLVEY